MRFFLNRIEEYQKNDIVALCMQRANDGERLLERAPRMGRKGRSEGKESKPFESREFYTVAQLADLLQLNEMTVYRIIKTGELRYYQIGRMMRFRNDDVEEFLKQRRVPPRDRPENR